MIPDVSAMMRWLWTTLGQRSHPRLLSTSGFQIIDASVKVDEEQLEHYKPSRFYHINIHDILDSRYQVLSKLGYGSCSTVWLSHDIMFVNFPFAYLFINTLNNSRQGYVAIKVCISNYLSIEHERATYAHLQDALRTHSGESSPVRSSLADFELPGAEGSHCCFVFEPLTIDLEATRAVIQFDEALFKTIAFYLFRALEFIHTKAQMVHCSASRYSWHLLSCNINQDIRPENLCLTVIDKTTFQSLESLESVRPSPRKIYSNRIIYEGVGQVIPEDKRLLGTPVLCDFGEARFGQKYYEDPIQPFMYQAPEVVFKIPWSYPADIWNAGVMASV